MAEESSNKDEPVKLVFYSSSSSVVGTYLCPSHVVNAKIVPKSTATIPEPNLTGFFKCIGRNNNEILFCPFTTDSEEEFQCHYNKHRKFSLLVCFYCINTNSVWENSYTYQAMMVHMKNWHKHLYFQCNLCRYRAITADHVNIHQLIYHFSSPERVIYSCQIPKYNQKSTLEHFFVVEGKTKVDQSRFLQCVYCDDIPNCLFDKFADLIVHLVEIHYDFPMLFYIPDDDSGISVRLPRDGTFQTDKVYK